jgi:hypothetical protein
MEIRNSTVPKGYVVQLQIKSLGVRKQNIQGSVGFFKVGAGNRDITDKVSMLSRFPILVSESFTWLGILGMRLWAAPLFEG